MTVIKAYAERHFVFPKRYQHHTKNIVAIIILAIVLVIAVTLDTVWPHPPVSVKSFDITGNYSYGIPTIHESSSFDRVRTYPVTIRRVATINNHAYQIGSANLITMDSFNTYALPTQPPPLNVCIAIHTEWRAPFSLVQRDVKLTEKCLQM